MYSLFAILGTKYEPTLRRLTLDKDDQSSLATKIRADLERSYDGRDPVDYEPGYKPNDDEVMSLELELPAALQDLPTNHVDVEDITKAQVVNAEPRALVVIDHDDDTLHFYVVDSRNFLARRAIWSLTSKERLKPIPGIAFGDRLDALYSEGSLYFVSEYQASRLVDLSEFMWAATDPQVDQVLQHDLFDGSVSLGDIEEVLTKSMRKKVAYILQSGVLDEIAPTAAFKHAKTLKIPLGRSKGRLVLPTDKAELKEVLSFLAEDIYPSILRTRIYVASSKRRRAAGAN